MFAAFGEDDSRVEELHLYREPPNADIKRDRGAIVVIIETAKPREALAAVGRLAKEEA